MVIQSLSLSPPHTNVAHKHAHTHTHSHIVLHHCNPSISPWYIGNSVGEEEVECVCVKVHSDLISSVNQMKDTLEGEFENTMHFTITVCNRHY